MNSKQKQQKQESQVVDMGGRVFKGSGKLALSGRNGISPANSSSSIGTGSIMGGSASRSFVLMVAMTTILVHIGLLLVYASRGLVEKRISEPGATREHRDWGAPVSIGAAFLSETSRTKTGGGSIISKVRGLTKSPSGSEFAHGGLAAGSLGLVLGGSQRERVSSGQRIHTSETIDWETVDLTVDDVVLDLDITVQVSGEEK